MADVTWLVTFRLPRIGSFLIWDRGQVVQGLFSYATGGVRYLIQSGGRGPDGSSLAGCAFAHQQKLAAGALYCCDPVRLSGIFQQVRDSRENGFHGSLLVPDRPAAGHQLTRHDCGQAAEKRLQ